MMIEHVKYFLLLTMAAALPPSPAAAVTPCPGTTTLEDLAPCLEGRMPDENMGGYVPPGATERAAWKSVVEDMLDGTLDNVCETIALPLALAGSYEISRFTDGGDGKDYCVLVELADAGDADKRGWGTFITNLDPRRELAIQIPHPLKEDDTTLQGLGIFKQTRARSLIVAGAHRRAHTEPACQNVSDYRKSDVAHHHENMFSPATRALIDWYEAQGIRDELVAMQFHGMESCLPDLYMTYGRPPGSGTPQPGDELLDLRAIFVADFGWNVDLPGFPTDPNDPCGLHGSLNLQGRRLNFTGAIPPANFCGQAATGYTGNFIHVEQKTGVFRETANWVGPLKQTWPAPEVVVLVDTSGSMRWGYDGTFSVPVEHRRLTLARDAVQEFLDLLADHGGGVASAGLAEFPAHPFAPAQPTTGAVRHAVVAVNDTTTGDLVAAQPALPEGATPLLGGVATALDMLSDDEGRAIVVLSDGYHNHPGPVGVGSPEVNDLIALLQDPSSPTRVYTIGFGLPTDVDHPLLEKLAADSGGAFYDVTQAGFDPNAWDPGTQLRMTYKMVLADALGLQVPVDPVAVIVPHETQVSEVRIHPRDRRVSFVVTWSTPDPGLLDLAVRASDGTQVPLTDPAVRTHEGSTYRIVTVERSFLEQPGKVDATPWRLEVAAGHLNDRDREIYQYGVLADSRLEMEARVDRNAYVTGDPVTLTATLTEAGEPIKGLGDVQVTVVGPEAGLGNWLAEHDVSDADLERVREDPAGEPLSLLQRKTRALADQGAQQPGRSEIAVLPLFDDGTHGDALADDGTYTNRFSSTWTEGSYEFAFRAVRPIATAEGLPFERERRLTRFISLAVESVEPAARGAASRTPGNDAYEIDLTARDAFGNLPRPGYAGTVRVETTAPVLAEEVADNADGTYTVYLELPGGTDPFAVDLTIELKGAPTSFNLGEALP